MVQVPLFSRVNPPKTCEWALVAIVLRNSSPASLAIIVFEIPSVVRDGRVRHAVANHLGHGVSADLTEQVRDGCILVELVLSTLRSGEGFGYLSFDLFERLA